MALQQELAVKLQSPAAGEADTPLNPELLKILAKT